MTDQTRVFEAGEGDAWFRRNAGALGSRSTDPVTDMALGVITEGGGSIRSVCEVGSANGWRLAALNSAAGPRIAFSGCDVSEDAIADGKGRWPELDLRVGAADSPPFEGPFHLLIASFVLHWVDRSRLARTVAAIDQLLGEGGYLIVSDFLPDAPCKTAYHHLPNGSAFTYKQDYRAAFLGLGFYREVSANMFGHGGSASNGGEVHEQDRAITALLQKTMNTYRLVERA